MWLALAIYLVLRSTSGAITPATAPDYYRLSLAPGLLARNLFEYADRAGTVAAAVSLLMVLIVPRRAGPSGPAAWFSDTERSALIFAALWIPAMYVLTVFLPVRSSLYALMPSIGSALVAGACASRALRLQPVRFTRLAAALLVTAAALVPVYRGRNTRWVAPAELSRHVMESIQATTSSFPGGGRVVLIDAPAADVGLDDAFDESFSTALTLYAGELWTGQVVAPGVTAEVSGPADRQTTITYELRDGTLEPLSINRR
jgi:hypothetical protein